MDEEIVLLFHLGIKEKKIGQGKILLSPIGLIYFLRLNIEKMKDVCYRQIDIFHGSMKLMKDNCILWLFNKLPFLVYINTLRKNNNLLI